jgi:hypothetical protein
MTRARTLLAVVVSHVLALGVFAQNETAEFGRASGGSIDALTKRTRKTSGSLGLTQSTGAFEGLGYEATLGGELLNDRLWFFAAGSVRPQMQFTSDIMAIDAKATAQPVDWTNVTASFSQLRQPAFTNTLTPNDRSLPASFLSLRSTSVLSDRMTLDFSFSQQTGTRSSFGLTPAREQ